MSPRAKKPAPKRRRAPGAGRPRTVRAPGEDGRGPRLELVLDEASGLALLRYAAFVRLNGVGKGEASASVRELLTAWGESAGVRKAVEAWRKERAK